jgi:ribosomal protein L37AE/L43A
MGTHAAAFYCPYCGEEGVRALGRGLHHCPDCDRHFNLAFVGLAPRTPTTTEVRDVRDS